MKRIALAAACLAALSLTGCNEEPTQQMQIRRTQEWSPDQLPVADNPRVDVTRIGVVRDSLAYENRRGIYLIRDNETGREWIGLSGVGIAEVGSHSVQSGKTRTSKEDER